MDFTIHSIRFQEEIRKEISRLEHELLRLKEIERQIGTYLVGDIDAVSSDIATDRKDISKSALSPQQTHSNRQGSIGDDALRILQTENRDFSLDELTDRLASVSGALESRDLKNAVRVALVRRKDQVLRTGRGLYRLRPSGSHLSQE
jgi:ribosomal protein L29